MRTELFIDGGWRPGGDGTTIAVEDPATAQIIAEVASATPGDAMAACDAAAAAQPGWAATAPRARAELLRAAWQSMHDHADELADLIVLESGKPLADARGEVEYAAEFFRWNSEEAVRIRGAWGQAPGGDKDIMVRHPPMGVVVMVTPWNFPAAMLTRKLAPALAAGNTVVAKPASATPLTSLRIAELMHDVGFPSGTVNVTPSSDAGAWFDAATSHTATRMVSFTGSTEVGRKLLEVASRRVLKCVMELGGNAPFIVLDDADIDAAVVGAMQAKMRHSAETCTAANRFFVQRGVLDAFTGALAAAMSEVIVGPGQADGVGCGPLIDAGALDRVAGLVDDAVSGGARAIIGGRRMDGPGHFYAPTVLADVQPGDAITREELFGPVATIIAFDDVDTMLADANDTEMGLAGYVFGSPGRALAVAERLEAGMVGVNRGLISDPASPFGGMKQSGLGREGSTDGIYEFCETQYLAI
jgi:succinate-semialdehyde dehydrogenase/glutarate-semialdehyde dehydrogenase